MSMCMCVRVYACACAYAYACACVCVCKPVPVPVLVTRPDVWEQWIPPRPWAAEDGLLLVKEALVDAGVPVAYMQCVRDGREMWDLRRAAAGVGGPR